MRIVSKSKCQRTCNLVADCPAAHGANLGDVDSSLCLDHAPDFICNLVSGDVLSCSIAMKCVSM
jgi:hypothetical protein